MSHVLTIQQASERLGELVRALGPADEILLTENDKPIARIVPSEQPRALRKAGVCKGMIEIRDDSDDEILEHFKDYTP